MSVYDLNPWFLTLCALCIDTLEARYYRSGKANAKSGHPFVRDAGLGINLKSSKALHLSNGIKWSPLKHSCKKGRQNLLQRCNF